MVIYTDFHIHTALSPCGDNDMTPNNVINMAILKELDAIAITDHNSAENVLSCMEVARDMDLLVIPGMELQTREDIHAICLFDDINKLLDFQEYVYNHLPNLNNNEAIFGEQQILDKEDKIVGKNTRFLFSSADISFDDAYYAVSNQNGVFIPAHIDKTANSIISNLGFIPDYLNITTIEYRSIEKIQVMINKGILKDKYNYIKSSDAHYLEDILERVNTLEVEEKSIKGIFKSLKLS